MDSQNPDPSDNSSSRESSSKLGIIALVCFVLPLFYLFGTGPYVWAIENGHFPNQVEKYLDKFYLPLECLAFHWEPFERLMKLYIALWVDIP